MIHGYPTDESEAADDDTPIRTKASTQKQNASKSKPSAASTISPTLNHLNTLTALTAKPGANVDDEASTLVDQPMIPTIPEHDAEPNRNSNDRVTRNNAEPSRRASTNRMPADRRTLSVENDCLLAELDAALTQLSLEATTTTPAAVGVTPNTPISYTTVPLSDSAVSCDEVNLIGCTDTSMSDLNTSETTSTTTTADVTDTVTTTDFTATVTTNTDNTTTTTTTTTAANTDMTSLSLGELPEANNIYTVQILDGGVTSLSICSPSVATAYTSDNVDADTTTDPTIDTTTDTTTDITTDNNADVAAAAATSHASRSHSSPSSLTANLDHLLTDDTVTLCMSSSPSTTDTHTPAEVLDTPSFYDEPLSNSFSSLDDSALLPTDASPVKHSPVTMSPLSTDFSPVMQPFVTSPLSPYKQPLLTNRLSRHRRTSMPINAYDADDSEDYSEDSATSGELDHRAVGEVREVGEGGEGGEEVGEVEGVGEVLDRRTERVFEAGGNTRVLDSDTGEVERVIADRIEGAGGDDNDEADQGCHSAVTSLQRDDIEHHQPFLLSSHRKLRNNYTSAIVPTTTDDNDHGTFAGIQLDNDSASTTTTAYTGTTTTTATTNIGSKTRLATKLTVTTAAPNANNNCRTSFRRGRLAPASPAVNPTSPAASPTPDLLTDYIVEAGHHVNVAVKAEQSADIVTAHRYLKSAIAVLIRGVQGYYATSVLPDLCLRGISLFTFLLQIILLKIIFTKI